MITGMKDSAHFLECMKLVVAKHPTAKIVTVKQGSLWKLVADGVDLSGPHAAHYACYVEARKNL